jgi:hypothetical protein
MRHVRRVVAAVFVVAAALVALAFPHAAGAQAGSERIASYDVDLTIEPDGTLVTREVITYDFGANQRHGIQRDLVIKELYDDDHDRRYDVEVTGVSADPGTPDDVQISDDGGFRRIRIGDPDRTITGVHTYTIEYTVTGALKAFEDHDELNWDVIGHQWNVPIDRASARVQAPADITQVACFQGVSGSRLGCAEAAASGATATFGTSDLDPNAGMTIVVALPKGAIQPEPAPILVERRTLEDAFAINGRTLGASGALAVLGIGAVSVLAWRRGRDRRWTGPAVDAAMGNLTGEEQRIPLGRQEAGTVEFVPPDKVRPGQVGTLIDERANLLDVTATIVDLAVRGFLRITELDDDGKPDYQLDRLEKDTGELHPYERELLDSLFATGPSVKLSDLKYEFTSELASLKEALYDDVVANGWYRVRPDRTRLWWRLLGIAVVVVGVLLTILVASTTSFGLIPLAIVLTGIVLLAVGGTMPARTGKGSAMLSRIRGFRRLFDEGEEDTRARFAEQQGIFSQYLPYAIVFGCTEKWARAFEGLSAEQLGATGWYQGPNLFGAYALSSAMNSFETTATGTLYASQPSSSSASGFSGGGFSGGGGGGGGGGSW